MPKKILIILAIITFAVAFVIARFWPSQSTTGLDYKNGTYVINDKPVALVNGYSEEVIPGAASKVITNYFGNEVKADFNNDGLEDVAFLLTQQTGGTGLFYYTAVALGSADGFIPVGTDLIGDRIAPQTTEYKDGMITVNYADRASNESFAVAPSIALSKYYKIIDGQLRAVVPPLNQIESEAHQAIKQLLISKYPKYAKTLQINVRQETNDYAVGAIGFEPGAPGGQYLAVKKDGNWQFVYEGNGSIDCVKIKQDYNFPEPMLQGFCELSEPIGLLAPVLNAKERVTKKPFGMYITPKDSPINPEKFTGYHTGTDFEIFAGEEDLEVPVFVACTGKLLFKDYVSGYGGVAVQSCNLNDQAVTVLYGHLKISSITAKIDEELTAENKLGVLGKGYSPETDGERKHLHFSIHLGPNVELKGYVKNKADLESWLDPVKYFNK